MDSGSSDSDSVSQSNSSASRDPFLSLETDCVESFRCLIELDGQYFRQFVEIFFAEEFFEPAPQNHALRNLLIQIFVEERISA